MCRVLELLQVKDGILQAAKVQVVSTDGKKEVLTRSLKHLIPLKVSMVEKAFTDCCHDTQNANSDTLRARDALLQVPAPDPRRPKRNASIIADIKLRDQS